MFLQHHPDKNHTDPKAHEKYVEIQQAFDALYKFQKTDEDGDMGPEYPHEWHQYAGSNRDREDLCVFLFTYYSVPNLLLNPIYIRSTVA